MKDLRMGWLVLLVLALLVLGGYLVFYQPNFYLWAGKIKLAFLAGVLLITGIVCLVTKPRR